MMKDPKKTQNGLLAQALGGVRPLDRVRFIGAWPRMQLAIEPGKLIQKKYACQ